MTEPLDDNELKQLLRQWKAPEAPPGLERRVLPRPLPWWKWLFTGSIRIPVPVGLAAVLVLLLWILWQRPAPVPAPVAQSPGSTLANFQPVEQLQPTIVERKNDNAR